MEHSNKAGKPAEVGGMTLMWGGDLYGAATGNRGGGNLYAFDFPLAWKQEKGGISRKAPARGSCQWRGGGLITGTGLTLPALGLLMRPVFLIWPAESSD